MVDKQWYEKSWDEMNLVQLVNRIVSWAELVEFGGWKPSEEEREEYRQMYAKAINLEPNNYRLLGAVLPEYFGNHES